MAMSKASRRRSRTVVPLRRAGDLPPFANSASASTQANVAQSVAERITSEAIHAIDDFADVLARLRGLTARLGGPSGTGKDEPPKPCRAGRLGEIEDKVETLRMQASVAAEQLGFIEQQI